MNHFVRTLVDFHFALVQLMVEVVRAGAVFWGSIGDFSVQTNTLYWNQFFLEISRAHLSNPFIPTASTSSEDLSTRIGEFIDAIKHLPYPPLWRYTARDRGGFDTARDMLLERISPSTEHVKSDGRIHEVYEWQARWHSTICGQETLPAGSQSPTWFPYVCRASDTQECTVAYLCDARWSLPLICLVTRTAQLNLLRSLPV